MSVSYWSVFCMTFSMIAAVAMPAILFIIFRRKAKADISPFFIGCAVMIVAVFILEATVNRFVFSSGAGSFMRENIWLYAVYGGLMAGIFEETGRFTAIRLMLRKSKDSIGRKQNALMYGAGHGGLEAVATLGIPMLGNIFYSVIINSGKQDTVMSSLSGDALVRMQQIFSSLANTPPAYFLAGSAERFFALVLQISLSVIVFRAAVWSAADKKFLWLYPIAILIHSFVDFVTLSMSRQGVSVIMMESVIALLALSVAVIAKKVWNSL